MASAASLSKELLDLVKAIGESRSKQEEDKIIVEEAALLKTKINQRNITEKKMRDLLIRAIYVEMLGHDASFAHIHALNLTQSKNILIKRVGYLACTLFLDETSDLLILLVSTLQRDLQSQNHLEVLAALNTLCRIANSSIMAAVQDPVQRLLSHMHEMVRKKTVMVLHRFYCINPQSIESIDKLMRKALCDKDPSVMSATLNYYQTAVKANPYGYKELVSSFVVILKQIVEHRLPKDFDYHKMPAPWTQMKILELLGYLGAEDQGASENMYEIITQTLKRADDTGINIGYAIIY